MIVGFDAVVVKLNACSDTDTDCDNDSIVITITASINIVDCAGGIHIHYCTVIEGESLTKFIITLGL